MRKKHLFTLAIVVFICLSLGVGFSIMVIELATTRESNLKDQQQLLLTNIRTPIQTALQSVRLATEVMALSPQTKKLLSPGAINDMKKMRTDLQRILALFPLVEFMAVLDIDLNVRLTSYPTEYPLDFSAESYVKIALEGRRILSEPFTSPITGVMVMASASPITHEGQFIGVAVAFINVQKLANITTNTFTIGKTGYAMLVDAHGKYILHPDSSIVGKSINCSEWNENISPFSDGFTEGLWSDIKRTVVFTTFPETDWKLMVSIDHDEYMMPVTALRNTAVLVGCVMMLFIGGGVSWLIVLLTRELDRARLAAEESDRAKSDFLANMSHEIRTPMNAIIGLAHLLGQTSLTDRQTSYLKKLTLSGNNLMRLLNDILDVSKIEAGKMELDCHHFPVSDIILLLQNLFVQRAAEKGIAFAIDISERIPPVLCTDSLRLGQILVNMISNAIKFTEHGGVRVTLDAEPVPTRPVPAHASDASPSQHLDQIKLYMTVSDTGIGMTEEQLKHLFQPFSQADTSTTRKYGGTGLGLMICKHLSHLLGGDIEVDSVGGKGTTFRCFIVCSEGKPEALEPPVLLIKDTPDPEDAPHTVAYAAKDDEQPTSSAPTKKPLVLLAEDNEINQLVASELLHVLGMEVLVASNGLEAVELAKQHSFDLIFMDIQMPVMDGFTAVQCIRQRDTVTPIVAMTAHAMSTDRDKSLAVGMNEHITKPISPEILRDIVQLFIKQQTHSEEA